MKSRFLIRGGKGKIGVGERQISKEDIIITYENNFKELFQINNKLREVSFKTSLNTSIMNYHHLPFIQMDDDIFSRASLFFNPNSYALARNTKDEFFFGIDRNKPNSRFDPRGTVIKLDKALYNDPYNPRAVTFYCSSNEVPAYVKNSLVFYKIYPENSGVLSYDFSRHFSYNFSIIRESIPQVQNTSLDVKLIDVPVNTNVTANEIKAEVRASILYLTIKNAKTSLDGSTSFLVCQLPSSYRPSKDFNLNFVNTLGDGFLGSIDTNGGITVKVNGKTEEGVFLQTAIPI